MSGIAVSPGSQAGPGQTAYQSQAQRVWMDDWGSGKPGTRTWLALNNYPNGWLNYIGGVADWPSAAKPRDFGTFTTTGSTSHDWKSITIPSTAPPGYAYWMWANHDGGPLSLSTWFQVCTLKPSRSAVRRARRSPSAAWYRSRGTTGARGNAHLRPHLQDHVLQPRGQGPAAGQRGQEARRQGPRSAGSAPTASASTARVQSVRRASPGTSPGTRETPRTMRAGRR